MNTCRGLRVFDTIALMPKSRKETKPVRMSVRLAKQIELIAAALDLSVPDYLDSVLIPAIRPDLDRASQELDRMRSDNDPPEPPKKKR
jgi:hypothetical protein